MLNKWPILGIVIAVIGISSPAQQNQNSAKKHYKVSQQAVSPAGVPNPSPVSQESTVIEEVSPKEKPENFFRQAFAPEFFSNWILVLVGIGAIVSALRTLGTIRRQTQHIARQAASMRRQTTILRESVAAIKGQGKILERQTKAVEDSVSLQKTLKRQWLEYENWRIEPRWDKSIGTDIRILFDIANNTDMPLTIQSITLSVNLINTTTRARTDIPPKGLHPVFLDVFNFTQEQVHKFNHDNLVLTFMGSVSYRDAFRDDRSQGISRIFMGGKSGFTSTEGPGWIPSEEEDEGQGN
jgi:hypothetical protein